MHPSVKSLLAYFNPLALPAPPWDTQYRELAQAIAEAGTGPEVTVALRKLLESRDAMYRVLVNDLRESTPAE